MTGSATAQAPWCKDPRRRHEVRGARLNGVDGVEVHDDGLTLVVSFLGKAPVALDPGNVKIDGGRRITGIRAIEVTIEREDDAELDDRAYVAVDKTGDTSTYRLALVEPDEYGRPGDAPLHGFDPRYTTAEFDFHPNCPTDQDCASGVECRHEPTPEPVIDYTTRDYGTIRRQLFDRMSLVIPDWVERHAADLGVTIVELFAYVGDQLEYQLDALAAEAYLDTARKRVSVSRHARLIDYTMHDGCNARAFVIAEADEDVTLKPGTFRLLALDLSDVDPIQRPLGRPVLRDDDLDRLPHTARYEVFEPVTRTDWSIRQAHRQIQIHTWLDAECCLPTGATSATLIDQWVSDEGDDRERLLALEPGEVVIFEEVLGPSTGAQADADPAHRQAVRLTSVTAVVDALNDQPLLDVTWAEEDALTFSVCISAVGGPDCELIEDITVVRGNVLLVDHGRDLTFCDRQPEEFPVPRDPVAPFDCASGDGCADRPDRGPQGDVIAQLLAQADTGNPLTAEHVNDLANLLGWPAVNRAGLDAQAPAADQAAQLGTLLSQLGYPATTTGFRPVLSRRSVTQRVPFPDRSVVASGQAALLETIPVRARAFVDALWRGVKAGDELGEGQVGELWTLFGSAVSDELLEEDPASALRDLLLQFDALLDPKLRRLERLAARAYTGRALADWLPEEIRQTWGWRYADGLAPTDPRLAGPARVALEQDPRKASPAIRLRGGWRPRRDMLGAGPRDRVFVGDTDEDGITTLRFGDGVHGARPDPGSIVEASYRIGNGQAGNVGAEGIGWLVACGADASLVTRVRNPMAALGGTDPEPMDDVRLLAPLALRRQRLRAVTAADYAQIAAETPGVQRAAADIRWTGTVSEVHVAVDALGADSASDAVLARVARRLAPCRRIGHELVVGTAELVPIDLALMICAAPGFQRAHVKQSVRRAVRALFDPDVVTFGAAVRVSRIVAAAAAVPGVATARVTTLKRLFGDEVGELDDGVLVLGPLEVAQLADDANLPEHGRLRIDMGGGR